MSLNFSLITYLIFAISLFATPDVSQLLSSFSSLYNSCSLSNILAASIIHIFFHSLFLSSLVSVPLFFLRFHYFLLFFLIVERFLAWSVYVQGKIYRSKVKLARGARISRRKINVRNLIHRIRDRVTLSSKRKKVGEQEWNYLA